MFRNSRFTADIITTFNYQEVLCRFLVISIRLYNKSPQKSWLWLSRILLLAGMDCLRNWHKVACRTHPRSPVPNAKGFLGPYTTPILLTTQEPTIQVTGLLRLHHVNLPAPGSGTAILSVERQCPFWSKIYAPNLHNRTASAQAGVQLFRFLGNHEGFALPYSPEYMGK